MDGGLECQIPPAGRHLNFDQLLDVFGIYGDIVGIFLRSSPCRFFLWVTALFLSLFWSDL